MNKSTQARTVRRGYCGRQAYRDPQTWLLVEVWIASKSDPELAERIDSILHRINDPIDTEIARVFSQQPGTVGDFRTYKYLLRSLTRGLAIEYSRKPDAELFDSVVDLIFAALETHLGVKGANENKPDSSTKRRQGRA